MPKLYQYTIFKEDGTKQVLPPSKKRSFPGPGGLYELMGWDTIQLLPNDYVPDGWNKRATYFIDENGRFKPHRRNPHFKVLTDALFGDEWDVVGDVLMEEVYHGDKVHKD